MSSSVNLMNCAEGAISKFDMKKKIRHVYVSMCVSVCERFNRIMKKKASKINNNKETLCDTRFPNQPKKKSLYSRATTKTTDIT
jgi:hypothetical protein